ncbi:MAG TPA: hypothetical protein VFR90_01670 [Methylibium sp.]|uniref:hypothetical protein n=1 Tax=Methylibium sp. TaxID=2067992 RepID=UPI002DB5B00C|nr:hypothetical protein [Methylibium sp.]HEU4457812.1 hypothetical protein [Methylibium sp.]
MSCEAARALPRSRRAARGSSRLWLGYVFAVFNFARVFAYMPTLWAIAVSGDSSQHSLITWFIWFGANLSMAGWLYEREGRIDRAVIVNLGNAAMCLAGLVLIGWYRL